MYTHEDPQTVFGEDDSFDLGEELSPSDLRCDCILCNGDWDEDLYDPYDCEDEDDGRDGIHSD